MLTEEEWRAEWQRFLKWCQKTADEIHRPADPNAKIVGLLKTLDEMEKNGDESDPASPDDA